MRLNTNLGYYTNFVNLLDLAAVAVPAGFRGNGLPFGISLIGPAFTDEALLGLAERFETGAAAMLHAGLRRGGGGGGAPERAAAQLATDGAGRAPAEELPHGAGVSAVCARRHEAAQTGAGAG